MNINKLFCEYRSNPLGIDISHPRLSWEFDHDQKGLYQGAYQIVTAKDEKLLNRESFSIWDTGIVYSDSSIHIPYDGPPLHSRQRVYWRVLTWDNRGKVGSWSPVSWFEMGLLNKEDWHASWIESDLVGDEKTGAPCPYFQKSFTLKPDITKARLYITALGLYEVFINGNRVGTDIFTPGWTDYDRRVHYQTYDVLDLLKVGKNQITAALGDGWFCGYVGWEDRQNYGERPRLLAQLEIEHSNGDVQTIVTNETWMAASGPILASDLIMGEDYDARLELDVSAALSSISDTEIDLNRWLSVSVCSAPEDLALIAQYSPPIRVQGEIHSVRDPDRITGSGGDSWIFDFGQNLVGRVRLKVSGKGGEKVIIRFGEMLTEEGHLYTENLRKARQTDTYILRGGTGLEIYEPHFTFHGFRYVQVDGLCNPPTRDLLTAIVLHSDNTPALRFRCSNPLVNQLQHNIEWGWKGNSLDVPSDCPQRDERLGWTGDAQVFIKTATYLTRSASFFNKWVQDLADAQSDYGGIPPYAPYVPSNFSSDGGPAWSDAFVIVPWTIWQQYGDTRILETHYESMCHYMDYLVKNSPGRIRLLPNEKDLGPGKEEWIGGFGDWLAKDGSEDRRGGTPRDLIGTAFLAYDASLMAQIAKVLARHDDVGKFSKLFEETRRAFQDRFINKEGLIASETQTAYVLALHFDLVPTRFKTRFFNALIKDIEDRDRHLSTGFVGTPYLCQVLTNGGRLDLAYALLLQQSCPSWLYPILHGATTIWERWDGWTEENGFQDPRMNSFNHYAYGAIGSWLVETVAGIKPISEFPGFKHFQLNPGFPTFPMNEGEERIIWADAEYHSPYGLIKSRWEMVNNTISWEVVIPPNTSAIVYIPTRVKSPVTVNNRLLADEEGITLLKFEKDDLLLSVESGVYTFHLDIMRRRGK